MLLSEGMQKGIWDNPDWDNIACVRGNKSDKKNTAVNVVTAETARYTASVNYNEQKEERVFLFFSFSGDSVPSLCRYKGQLVR